jgi:RNase P protein component
MDLVVIPRAPAATMTVAELEAVLARLFGNLGRGHARAREA